MTELLSQPLNLDQLTGIAIKIVGKLTVIVAKSRRVSVQRATGINERHSDAMKKNAKETIEMLVVRKSDNVSARNSERRGNKKIRLRIIINRLVVQKIHHHQKRKKKKRRKRLKNIVKLAGNVAHEMKIQIAETIGTESVVMQRMI